MAFPPLSRSDHVMSWSFHNPVEIKFAPASLTQVFERLPYHEVLFVTSRGMCGRGTARAVMAQWSGPRFHLFDNVLPNPDIRELDSAALLLADAPFDAILALGGGSVLDTAKVLSVLLANRGSFTLADHFHHGLPFPQKACLPLLAIPTTSGTGSEVTPFATVWDAAHKKKYSLSSPRMYPELAILDPSLTSDLPWEVTVPTGLDALCQGMESIWNRNATPLTMGIAETAVRLAWQCLERGREILKHPELRAQLMEASLLAGMAISQTRTALCHSISYPITARFGVPHGLACGIWMPQVLSFNAPADDGRLARLALLLGFASMPDFRKGLEQLLEKLEAWSQFEVYVPDKRILLPFVGEMMTLGRADNNLRDLSAKDVNDIINW